MKIYILFRINDDDADDSIVLGCYQKKDDALATAGFAQAENKRRTELMQIAMKDKQPTGGEYSGWMNAHPNRFDPTHDGWGYPTYIVRESVLL